MTGDERLREEQPASDERAGSAEQATAVSGVPAHYAPEHAVMPDGPLGAPRVLVNDVAPSGVSRRSAFRRVVVGLALAGVLVGVLWAWLAPSVQGVVALTRAGERIRGYVGDEADHLFAAAFVMLGLLGVVAVVSAALVWKWRSHRGPTMVSALTLGWMLAAGAATGVGAALAHWRYGTVDVAGAPISPQHRVHYVIEAPGVFFGHSPLQIAATIVVPAGLAALLYAICALSSSRDDLGAWPPVEQFALPVAPGGATTDVPPITPSSPSR